VNEFLVMLWGKLVSFWGELYAWGELNAFGKSYLIIQNYGNILYD
jgi:hypothetical protein